jgi:hypothetical protein
MDFNPFGIKYLGGWGDGSDPGMPLAESAGSVDEIIRSLKKYSLRDRRYIREKWRKHYLFYASSLLNEEDQMLALNDNYQKSIDKHLGLN